MILSRGEIRAHRWRSLKEDMKFFAFWLAVTGLCIWFGLTVIYFVIDNVGKVLK